MIFTGLRPVLIAALVAGTTGGLQASDPNRTATPPAMAQATPRTVRLWTSQGQVGDQADLLVRLLRAAPEDGLADASHEADRLAQLARRGRTGGPADRAAVETAFTAAMVRYVRDLRTPSPAASLTRLDQTLPSPPSDQEVLVEASKAPSLAEWLANAAPSNPIYAAQRLALRQYRKDWSSLPQITIGPGLDLTGPRLVRLRRRLGLDPVGGRGPQLAAAVRRFQIAHSLDPSGKADTATVEALDRGAGFYEARLRLNLDRARALPARFAGRLVVVDASGGELYVYEGDRLARQMRVAVGAPEHATPMVAGVLRQAVFQPYWNVPVDIARTRYAPRVVAQGPSALRAAEMEVLSDWTADARVIAPEEVDWPAVADGRADVRLRQRPGPLNMMGAVKLMLPNRLGIYLHDTPQRAVFGRGGRAVSAGCVRLEDASGLAEYLVGAAGRMTTTQAEERVAISPPTPIYITYFTAGLAPSGNLTWRPDIYDRDAAALAAVKTRYASG